MGKKKEKCNLKDGLKLDSATILKYLIAADIIHLNEDQKRKFFAGDSMKDIFKMELCVSKKDEREMLIAIAKMIGAYYGGYTLAKKISDNFDNHTFDDADTHITVKLSEKVNDVSFRFMLNAYLKFLIYGEIMKEDDIEDHVKTIVYGRVTTAAAKEDPNKIKPKENLITSIVERDGKIVMRKKAYSSEDLDREYLGIST